MALKFLTFDDPKLREPSQAVPINAILSKEIQSFIKEFLTFCGYEATPILRSKLTRMVGCAAPQVGVMRQVIVVDTAIHPIKRNFHQMDFHVLINPKIIWSSQEKGQYPESCYSVPLAYTGVINRSIAIVVEAYDQNENKVRRRYEGYTARVIQHEIDHLSGVRFPQRAQNNQDIHKINFSKREDLLRYRSNWKDWNSFATSHELKLLKKGPYANM